MPFSGAVHHNIGTPPFTSMRTQSNRYPLGTNPLLPPTTEPCCVVPSVGLSRRVHSPPQTGSVSPLPKTEAYPGLSMSLGLSNFIGPDEKEVKKVLEELEEIQNIQRSKRISAEVVRLGALVGGAHPRVPQAANISAAEKVAIWKARQAPDRAIDVVREVPPLHPDWDDLVAAAPTRGQRPHLWAIQHLLGAGGPFREEGRASPAPTSLGHLSSPRSLSQERRQGTERSPGESSRGWDIRENFNCVLSRLAGLEERRRHQDVLARLASLEQSLEAERKGSRAIVERYGRLILERDEAHARDVDALHEMIAVAQAGGYLRWPSLSLSESSSSDSSSTVQLASAADQNSSLPSS